MKDISSGQTAYHNEYHDIADKDPEAIGSEERIVEDAEL